MSERSLDPFLDIEREREDADERKATWVDFEINLEL